MSGAEFHSWIPLLSRPGIIYIAEGDRDVGKSYPMLLRAMKRMQRNHRSMVWLRRTEQETKDWLAEFGNGKWTKIAKQAGLEMGRMRRQGDKILYNFSEDGKDSGSWVKLLRAGAVSGWASFRDTDDPNEEIIYLDEAFATVERYRMYRGDEVHDTLDILKSLRRQGSDIRLLLAGNAEKAVNPWFEYFGMDAPKIEEGFAMLRPQKKGAGYGAIPYERIRRHSADDLAALLDGTGYGDFLAGAPKGQNKRLIRPIPKGATVYTSVDFGRRLSIWASRDGLCMVVSLRNASGTVIRKTPNGDPNTLIYCSELRKAMTKLRMCWQAGRVYFDSPEALEWGVDLIPTLI